MNDELIGDNATLVWDGLSNVQLTYGQSWIKHKSVHTADLAKAMGERTIPIEALKAVELTLPKDGDAQLRLVLRENADPILGAAGGELSEIFDPYRFYYRHEQELLAEYYATEIKTAIELAQVGDGPASSFLVAPPPAPDELKGMDGRLSIAGDQLTFDWHWSARPAKTKPGKQRTVGLGDVSGISWHPRKGFDPGVLRLLPSLHDDPKEDPNTLLLGAYDIPALVFGAKLLAQIST